MATCHIAASDGPSGRTTQDRQNALLWRSAPASRQWLAQRQARINPLQSELAEAHAAGRAAMVYIGAGGASPQIVIRFDNNSSVVELDPGLLQALGNSAMAAKRVYLHRRTDSFTLSATAAELVFIQSPSKSVESCARAWVAFDRNISARDSSIRC